jgi:hypothetical protein
MILWLLVRRLQNEFSAVWDQLGRPMGYPRFSMFGVSWDKSQREAKAELCLMLFVFRSQYRDLRDRKVTLLVWSARLYSVLAVLVALAIFQGLIRGRLGN